MEDELISRIMDEVMKNINADDSAPSETRKGSEQTRTMESPGKSAHTCSLTAT